MSGAPDSEARSAAPGLIRSEAGLTGAEVTARTGLHPSTVRTHLERLVEAGSLVKARAGGGVPGRPPWRYQVAAPEPAPPPYRTLAAALLDHLATTGGGTTAAVAAGQAWGERLVAVPARPAGPIEATVDVLRELGRAARRRPAAGPAGGQASLEPFAAPAACVTRLRVPAQVEGGRP